MATYKNYIVKSGDTIENIAQKYLGDASKSVDIISLNRLRYPYIAQNILETLGPSKASSLLREILPEGSVSINFSSYISDGTISSLILSDQSIFYISTINQYRATDEKILKIKSYVMYDTEKYASGNLIFDTPLLNPPVASAETFNLLSNFQFCSFIGTISGNILTVTSIITGYISVGMSLSGINIVSGTIITQNIDSSGTTGTYQINYAQSIPAQILTAVVPDNISLLNREYYISYTFTTTSGETIGSPLNFNKNSGAPIPYVLQQSSSEFSQKSLLVFTAPTSWPSAATGIKIYVGTSPTQLFYQSTITLDQFLAGKNCYVEPVIGISYSTQLLPQNNTAYIGISRSYPIGTTFSIHENPEQFDTRIATVGSTLLLPTLSFQQVGFIINNKNPGQFVSALGTDICLDANGQIIFDTNGTGDILSVTGIDNLKQAILSRLLTRIENLKTQPQYGNSALSLIGNKYSSSLLLSVRSEIIRSLQRDPRVYSIDNIRVNYDASSQSVIVDNLSVKISNDGSSSSVLTFLPIALPI